MVRQKCSGIRRSYLGHLIMHRTVENDYLEDKKIFDIVESQADYFASCFLMPSNTFGR